MPGATPGGEPQKPAGPQRPPGLGEPLVPEKPDEALAQLRQKISTVAAQLGYVPGQKPGGQAEAQPEQGQVVVMATGADANKKAGTKQSSSTEEMKTDETDELGDFLSKIFLVDTIHGCLMLVF